MAARKAQVGPVPEAAWLLAGMLGDDPALATECALAAARAGLTPDAFGGATGAELYKLVQGGLVGPELRAAALAAGLGIGGIMAARELDGYVYRVQGSPAHWASVSRSQWAASEGRRIGLGLSEGSIDILRGLDRLGQINASGSAAAAADMLTVEQAAGKLRDHLKRIESEKRNGRVLLTGWSGIDSLTGPLPEGSVFVVAARPSVGKTMVGLNIANHVTLAGNGVDVFSLEMSAAQVMARVFSIDTGMPVIEQVGGCDELAKEYAGRKLRICEASGLTAHEALLRVRATPVGVRPRMVVYDYLGLLRHPEQKGATEAWAIGQTIKTIRAGAREYGHCALLLAQINRSGVGESAEPQLHHLRGSGDIEQDADFVLILTPTEDGIVANVAKNRVTGRCGKVNLYRLGDSCRLEER